MIDPTIEKALTKQEWKDGSFIGKTIAFLTSAALAWGLLIICLAVTYVMLKMPPLAPQTELPKTAVVAPAKDQFVEPNKKVVKPTVKKAEVKPTVNKMETVAKPKADLSPIDTAPIPPSPPFPPN
jgi:hypothetical protein